VCVCERHIHCRRYPRPGPWTPDSCCIRRPHVCDPQCASQAAGSTSAGARAPESVRLVARPGAQLAPGQQVTFSYGDKGNEELLLLYGARLPHAGPHHLLGIFVQYKL